MARPVEHYGTGAYEGMESDERAAIEAAIAWLDEDPARWGAGRVAEGDWDGHGHCVLTAAYMHHRRWSDATRLAVARANDAAPDWETAKRNVRALFAHGGAL